MTDEKLDNILRQALTPDVLDEDIYIYKRVRKKNMKIKRIFKAGIAVAVCAAFIVTANISGVFAPKVSVGDTDTNTTAEATAHPFVLTCYASELKEGVQVPVSLKGDAVYGSGLCGDEDDPNAVSYMIGAQFTCEGENISSITYSINSGAIFVTEAKGDSILTDYEEYTGTELNVPDMGFVDEDDAPSKYDHHTLSSYTVSYDRQESDTTMFGICGVKSDASIYNAVFGENASLDDTIAAYTALMDGVEITCTVTYNDGSTDSKVIVVKGCKTESAIENEDGVEEPYDIADFAYELTL